MEIANKNRKGYFGLHQNAGKQTFDEFDEFDDGVLEVCLGNFSYAFWMDMQTVCHIKEVERYARQSKMNDIDDLKDDIYHIDNRISALENQREEERPYFLYGYNGPVRKCIAVFSNEKLCFQFIKDCRLKNPKKNRLYKKNSPLFWWDEIVTEREYVPDHIFHDPKPEDFDERDRD